MLSPELHGGVVAGNVVTGCSQSYTRCLLPLSCDNLIIIISVINIVSLMYHHNNGIKWYRYLQFLH